MRSIDTNRLIVNHKENKRSLHLLHSRQQTYPTNMVNVFFPFWHKVKLVQTVYGHFPIIVAIICDGDVITAIL